MSGNRQSSVCNTYATLQITNPVFQGFLYSQNVSFGSKRDNQKRISKILQTSETQCFWGFCIFEAVQNHLK